MKRYWVKATFGYDYVYFSLSAANEIDAYYMARARAYDLFKDEKDRRILATTPAGDIEEQFEVEVTVWELPLPAYTFL